MIAVRDLTKSIGEQEILRGIDLEVAKGETLVIIGRSGGGKSVLLKHLIGLMQPDAGEIWIEGQNIIGLSERQLAPIRRKVGILFQGAALFDSMTVEENIAFPLREAGERDEKVIREKVQRDARGHRAGRAAEQDAGEPERRNEEARRPGAVDHPASVVCLIR